MPLAEAQARSARAGQMLALDPPLGAGAAATIGGVIAANDSGPLRHRYGGVRDLVVGITVVLSDGTIAKSGGKVIKNVAGYDLAKLFAGSFGTLGLIARVAVRLHPAPAAHRDGDRRAATTRTRSQPRSPWSSRRCRSRRTAWTPTGTDDAGWLAVRFAGDDRGRAGARRRASASTSGYVTIEDEDDDETLGARSARASARRTSSSRSPAARPTCRP